ncbi:MAG: flavin reductase [Candidatus Omnitrophota bacterium]
MTSFKQIKPEAITDNPFKLVGADWMLITAGTIDKYNMMTASWGGFGVLWHQNVCFCVIRPQRYTYEFMEKGEYFSLCFFREKYRHILEFCGSNSGRDVNKTEKAGLTPIEGEFGAVYFQQAKMVIIARKIYHQQIDPANFVDPQIENNYPNKDYHRMYVGKVIRVLLNSRSG